MRRELPFGNDRRKKDDDDAIVEKEDKNFEVYFQGVRGRGLNEEGVTFR